MGTGLFKRCDCKLGKQYISGKAVPEGHVCEKSLPVCEGTGKVPAPQTVAGHLKLAYFDVKKKSKTQKRKGVVYLFQDSKIKKLTEDAKARFRDTEQLKKGKLMHGNAE